ncbi:MAG TPA: glycoside hydrolase family 2 TIM barrel-domain containing protein [Ignavibacteriales bacterium]|nr:glycoside hydrolase family 2 TIM barrel-domain containing protein [Ignavibacteriales bacterium]
MKKLALLLALGVIFSPLSSAQNYMNLEGKWRFAVDSLDMGVKEKWFNKKLQETVKLPGSMASNGKGNDITVNTQWTGSLFDSSYFKDPFYAPYRKPGNIKVPFFLQPVKEYVGAAWYQKDIDIPDNWHGKTFQLFFERCHWESQVWIDGQYIGMQNSLGAPHIFDLTGKLAPGRHVLTVRVDNRIKDINPGINSSSLTDHSQTNWNGIIGRICITTQPKIYFDDVRIFTDIYKKSANVELKVVNRLNERRKVKIYLRTYPVFWERTEPSGDEFEKEYEINPGDSILTIEYQLYEWAALWDEFSPNRQSIDIRLTSKDIKTKGMYTFAFRKLAVKGTQFTVNDRLIFLRGTLECAVFPKTGYPSMDVEEWRRIFKKCKEYGLNHMRFHSWCPPEAAFEAADELGFYLYVECSSWANFGSALGDGKPIDQYIIDESERIIKAYGNHPSFCFMTYGNEPAGDNHQKYLTDFVSRLKKEDNRRLYSSATGWPQLDVNDFHSMYEPRIQLWGANLSGVINSQPPSSNYDWTNIISWRGKPVISHEIGQWCVYPNFKEIPKYDGLLKAKNFEIFRQSLIDNGMAHLADSFLLASGKLQVLCYKAEIEAALRTKNFGGFQLLDLHDFPGQGTALVGVLDPFWDEKGYVTAKEYTQFCNSTVPLARMSKFVFNSAEDLTASIETASFEQTPLEGVTPTWQITDAKGKVLAEGSLPKTDIPAGNCFKLGDIRYPLSGFASPAMYSLVVNVGRFTNKWDFWVYPYEIKEPLVKDDIRIVRKLDEETINFLNNGGMVLLTPVKGSIKPEKGGNIAVGFSSIFWNTAWTLKQAPHTLGILCNPDHPMLKDFPTEYHSAYQWRDAMMHSNAILLNELGKNFQPVVRIIDDWFTNRPLGLITEANVGKGKIVFTGIDLLTDAEKRPEARQLTYSILKYMRSEDFNPSQEVKAENIKSFF